jgi:hypothetical protein
MTTPTTIDRQADPDALTRIVYLTMAEIALESNVPQDHIKPWADATEDEKQICRRIAAQVAEPLERAFKAQLDALQERLAAAEARSSALQARLDETHKNHIDSWPL